MYLVGNQVSNPPECYQALSTFHLPASFINGEHELYLIKIKQKTFTALSTHIYEDKEPKLIKIKELKEVVQAATKDCIFLGWGQWCNNCKVATKSLCSFHAVPCQRYNTHRELATYVKAMPENLQSSIQCSNTALQIFEQVANTAAVAARFFQLSIEETLQIWSEAVANEGEEALQGVIAEDPAVKSSCSLIVETPYAKPGLLVEKVEASIEHESNKGTSAIVTTKSPSSDVVLPAPVHSPTPPISRHNDTAEGISCLANNALSSASALLATVTHDEPLSEPDSDRGFIIIGTPGADSNEDPLPSTSS
ncbi:hypothetical protein ARMGADRAFT_1034499 [Armillaria gallica]|uniref:Uncharacterized protein n=1 Tax=Armillaria gallica TaxID=47427 RepID=A0A2H3CY11_ARMGA|nr:hypothetical protein ARMGADRAFT_1034499 [Armillaria gallica]